MYAELKTNSVTSADLSSASLPPCSERLLVTSLQEDFDSIIIEGHPDPLMYFKEIGEGDHVKGHDRIKQQFKELGWDYVDNFKTSTDWAKAISIVKNGIEAPKTQFGFHATTSDLLDTIRKNGLNSILGSERNPGFMVRKEGAAFAGDIGYIRLSIESLTDGQQAEPVILRWKLDKEEPKYIISHTPPIPSEKLEYSMDDGKSWQKLIEDVVTEKRKLSPAQKNQRIWGSIKKFFD